MRKLLFLLLFFLPMEAQAQPKTTDQDLTSKDLSKAVDIYKACLNEQIYEKAKQIPNEVKLLNSVLDSCTREEAVVLFIIIRLTGKNPTEFHMKNIRSPAVREFFQTYRTFKEKYVHDIVISKTVYEQCAMANRKGAAALEYVMRKITAEDFAILRKPKDLKRAVDRMAKGIKAEIAQTSPEAWCQKTRESMENDEELRKLLFIE